MSSCIRTCLAWFLLAAVAANPAAAQEPATDRREALKLFAQALLCERESRLLEAVRLLEESVKLDPEAAPPRRALIPLYLALERPRDALASCRKALELN